MLAALVPLPGSLASPAGGVSNGTLLFHDGVDPDAEPVTVGPLQSEPRRIRCSLPLCAVTNFGSDSVTLVDWDGLTAPTVLDHVSVGDGPVGVDITPSGGNFAILTTGFSDNTYTVTTVTASGSTVSSATNPIPAGCTDPGHAIWLPANDSALISCNTSGNLVEIPGVLP